MENLNIQHIKSTPRYPEANGHIEDEQKTLQKQVNLNKDNINNEEDLLKIIYDILYTHNYKIKHSSTRYFPIELKDTTNPELINTVKKNIENKYKQFHNNDDSKYLIWSKYLLIEEGIVNKKS